MWVMRDLDSVRLETVLVSMQDRCTVCAKRTKARKSFWTHMMELLGDVCYVESYFCPFGHRVNIDPFRGSR
jgi:hypothetical protein